MPIGTDRGRREEEEGSKQDVDSEARTLRSIATRVCVNLRRANSRQSGSGKPR